MSSRGLIFVFFFFKIIDSFGRLILKLKRSFKENFRVIFSHDDSPTWTKVKGILVNGSIQYQRKEKTSSVINLYGRRSVGVK